MCRCACPRLDEAKADTEGAEHRDAALREVGRARQADAASTLRQASMVEKCCSAEDGNGWPQNKIRHRDETGRRVKPEGVAPLHLHHEIYSTHNSSRRRQNGLIDLVSPLSTAPPLASDKVADRSG